MATEDYTTGSVEVLSAKVLKIDGSAELDLIKTDFVDEPFRSLSITENLFSGLGVIGNLVISDMHGYGDTFNFSGGDIVEVTLATPLSEADQNVDYSQQEFGLVDTSYRDGVTITLYVNEVSIITDDTDTTPRSEDGIEVLWNLSLISYEAGIKNKIGSPFLNSEFIGKIADEQGEGLVNYYGVKHFENIDIEPTANSVWFKGTHAQYPWSKPGGAPSAIQAMNYLAENAVSKNNINACNYLFWQDLTGTWHFRSLDSIIKENGFGDLPAFNVSDDPLPKSNLTSFLGTKLINQVEFVNSNAYKGFYTKEYPSYRDPYSAYLPTHSKMISKVIKYDYEEDYPLWNHVESNKLIPETMKYDEIEGNEIEDSALYGYFDLKEYNDQRPTKLDEHKSSVFKTSMSSWQSKFDQTDLDAETLKKIRNDIIRPSKSALSSYILKRILKEKWNVYKYSICCDEQPTTIVGSTERELGYIIGFKRLTSSTGDGGWDSFYSPSLWKYYWTPIEVWEREEVLLNWNPEDGHQVRGAPIRSMLYPYGGDPESEGGVTNTHPLIAVRGLTLGEVPSVFEAWNVNEVLSSQPTLPSVWTDQPLDRTEYSGSLAEDFPGTYTSAIYDYIGPGLNKRSIANSNGAFPNQFGDLDGDGSDEETTRPFNVRTFNVMPVGGFLNFGATYPNSEGAGTEIPNGEDGGGGPIDIFEGVVEIGDIFCHGQIVEIFKYNRNQIESAGLTGNSDFIYLFNAENAIDSHPFNAYRILRDGWDSGITYDPYVPPGSEEEEDEEEEGDEG